MEAKNYNSENFSLLKLAQCAAFQKRKKSASLLYRLAMLSKPHLSPSIARLLETLSNSDEIVNTYFPSLCIIADVKYSDAIKTLLQHCDISSLEVSKVVLFADTSSYESLRFMDTLSDKHITVSVEDNSSLTPITYWLEHSFKDDNRDILPIFIDGQLSCRQFSTNDFLQLLAQSLNYPCGQSLEFHNENTHKFELSNVTNFELVLTVTSDEAVVEALKKLSLFSKITGIKVHLVASSAESIFSSESIMSWLEEETIERVQISDTNLHFCSDISEFIKKLNTERAVVLPIGLSRYALPFLYKLAFYKFEIPDFMSDWLKVVSVKDVQNSCESQFKNSFFKFYDEVIKEKKVSGFITAQAINRLGGVEVFRQHPLAYNGVLFSEINEWWLLGSPKLTKAKGLNYFPLEVKSNGKTSLVFDIQPITQEQHPTFRYLPTRSTNLRRRVITGRRLPNLEPVEKSQNALFIMTCFNKGEFVRESIFGVLMQTYPNVQLHFYDDASTDNSIEAAKNILSLVGPTFLYNIYAGKGGEGTYRLRNKVLHQSLNDSTVYLINDADDFSCARRAELQLSQLASPEKLYTFGDITRIDSHGRCLTLEGVTERYGTASFAAKAEIHQHYGFYENLKKGADTEFIERMQYFAPKDSGLWWRYPVLFQSYTNNNLTSDIYAITDQGNLVQDISARSKYFELFRFRHKRMLESSLHDVFSYDNVHFPVSYHQGIPEFFTSTPDAKILSEVPFELTLTGLDFEALGWETLPAEISKDNQGAFLQIVSELAADKHDYLMVNKVSDNKIIEALKENARGLYFKATNDLGVSFVTIYFDEYGERLSHQFFWVNQAMPVKMPSECSEVQFGFRIQGKGTCLFERVEVGNF